MINGLEVAGHSPANLQKVGKSKTCARPPGFRSKKELSKNYSRENSSRISSRSSISSSIENPQDNIAPKQPVTSIAGPPPKLNLSTLSSSRSVTADVGDLAASSKPWNLSIGLSERSDIPADFGIADDFLSVVNRAASSIQIWYRYQLKRRRAGELKVSLCH